MTKSAVNVYRSNQTTAIQSSAVKQRSDVFLIRTSL